MKPIHCLKCLICEKEYRPDEIDYICPDHGWEGVVDVLYDYDWIAGRISRDLLASNQDWTIWRYKPLLPVDPAGRVPPLRVGGTPLYAAPALEKRLGLKHLMVKDDGLQPTGSFKDRASAIALVKAWERGARILTTASTGNAAAALAGLCASVQQPNVIFVPRTAPPAKIAQLLAFGSRVLLVDGTYDQAFDLCLAAAGEYGWYNRNTGFNPYMSEGKKTASFEICEQCHWRAPDVVVVSVGDGCIIGGLYKGMHDLLALGWIERIPRLIGVQAEGSSFLARAWEDGEDVLTKAPVTARTVADSISTGFPRDRLKAMAAVRRSGGAFVRVSDERILAAIPTLAQGVGVFAEPAGAAAYAGLEKAAEKKLVDPGDRIVVLNTGNGLKDVAGAMRSVEMAGARARLVQPGLESVRRALSEDEGPL